MLLRTPVWTNSRVKPPFGAVQINRDHPLARGLAFFCLFRQAEPTGGIDLVRGAAGVATSSPNRTTRGLRCNNSWSVFGNVAVGGDAPYIASTGLTLLIRVAIDPAATSFQAFLMKGLTNGASNSPFDFRTDAGITQAHVLRANASGSNDFAGPVGAPNGVVVGEVAEHVFTFADNLVQTVPLVYKNGVSVAVGSSTPVSGAVTGASAPLLVGRRDDGAVTLNGEVVHAAIWSRPLLSAEVAAFYARPYAMLDPVVAPLPSTDLPQGEEIRLSRMRTW